jgi:hypothetical protein
MEEVNPRSMVCSHESVKKVFGTAHNRSTIHRTHRLSSIWTQTKDEGRKRYSRKCSYIDENREPKQLHDFVGTEKLPVYQLRLLRKMLTVRKIIFRKFRSIYICTRMVVCACCRYLWQSWSEEEDSDLPLNFAGIGISQAIEYMIFSEYPYLSPRMMPMIVNTVWYPHWRTEVPIPLGDVHL